MKKILCCVSALLLAGSVFFLGGWAPRVRKGVVVNGVPVGGMTYSEAALAVRAQLERTPFVLHALVLWIAR